MRKIKIAVGKKGIDTEKIVMLLILAVPFLNIWIFYGYRAKLFCVAALMVLLIGCRLFSVITYAKPFLTGTILWLYMTFSMLVKNFPTSAEYYIVLTCGFFIMSIQLKKQNIIFVIRCMTVIGVIYAVSMYAQWLFPDAFYSVLSKLVSEGPYMQAVNSPPLGDYTGLACESNRAGLCIAPATSYYFANFFFKENIRNKVLNIVWFLITYGALVLTGRRAFILFFPTILFGIAIYVLFRKKSVLSKLLGVFLIATVGLIGYYFLYDKVIFLLTNGSSSGLQLSNREVYWGLALRLFHQSPLIGNGMRSYDYNYKKMSGRDLIFAGAHNCYLQMLAEIGIIGLVLFLLFVLFMVFKTLSRISAFINTRNSEGAIIAITSIMMQLMFVFLSLSESAFIAPYSLILYYIIILLPMAYYIKHDTEIE